MACSLNGTNYIASLCYGKSQLGLQQLPGVWLPLETLVYCGGESRGNVDHMNVCVWYCKEECVQFPYIRSSYWLTSRCQ